jgi:hypothetical protein
MRRSANHNLTARAERTMSDRNQVRSPGWPAFSCNTRLPSSGHCGCKSCKASAKAWGLMPPGLCERLCCAAETAAVCKATRWTTTCRAAGLKRAERFTFTTKNEEKMECLLEPSSVGGPTMHGTRRVLVYYECNIGLSS